MASQLPNREIVQKTGLRHKNSRPIGRARATAREANPLASIAKTDYFRSQDMMEVVREFPCGHCGRQVEGNCGAHPNWSFADKGKSIKAHDVPATLCPNCHVPILDQGSKLTRAEREEMWLKAFYQTMLHGFRSGKFQVVK